VCVVTSGVTPSRLMALLIQSRAHFEPSVYRVGVGGHGEAGSSYSFVSGPLPGGGVGIEVLVAVAAGGEGDDTSHVLLGDGV
jgi:uncharacterized membrane protein